MASPKPQPTGQWFRRAKSDSVVVFVHGINSSADQCWRAGSCYWPKLLEEESTFKRIGIYLFSYRTDLWSADYNIDDGVDALAEFFEAHGLTHFKNVIFLCHSMGGILARRFLVTRKSIFVDRRIRVGLFLVASPSKGSKFADWLRPILKVLRQQQALALQTFERNGWLHTLDQEFKNLLSSGQVRIEGKELVEDLPLSKALAMLGSVVSADSGACYFPNPVKVPGSDHFTIAAPEGADSFQQTVLRTFLRTFLNLSDKSALVTNPSCDGEANIDHDFETPRVAILDGPTLFEHARQTEALFNQGATFRCFRLAKMTADWILTDLTVNDRKLDRYLRQRALSTCLLVGMRAASYLPEDAKLVTFLHTELEEAIEKRLLLDSFISEIVLELVAINQGHRNYVSAKELVTGMAAVSPNSVLQTKLRSRKFMADLSTERKIGTTHPMLTENFGQADRKHELRLPLMRAWDALRGDETTKARTIMEEVDFRLRSATEIYGSDLYDPMIQIEARLTLKSAIRLTEQSRSDAETENDNYLWDLYRNAGRLQPITLRPNLWDLIGGFESVASAGVISEVRGLHARYNRLPTVETDMFCKALEETTVRVIRLLSLRYGLKVG